MTASIENGKLLVVDTSTAMLHVLKNFTGKHGYEADHHADPADACVRLDQRFEDFASDYRSVILGWPEGRLDLVDEFLQKLNSSDHNGLPLIIISQEMNAAVKALVKRRPRTRALLWTEYQQASEIIDRLSARAAKRHVENSAGTKHIQRKPASTVAFARGEGESESLSILLVDTAPSICEKLRDLLELNAYQVSVATSVAEARTLLAEKTFDIVVTDFFLRGESGEELCQSLQESSAERKPFCVVLTAKYSDSIVKRSLAVGAVACLYKNESTDLLFARINALSRSLQGGQGQKAAPVTESDSQPSTVTSVVTRSQPGAVSASASAFAANSTATTVSGTTAQSGRRGTVKLVTRQRKESPSAAVVGLQKQNSVDQVDKESAAELRVSKKPVTAVQSAPQQSSKELVSQAQLSAEPELSTEPASTAQASAKSGSTSGSTIEESQQESVAPGAGLSMVNSLSTATTTSTSVTNSTTTTTNTTNTNTNSTASENNKKPASVAEVIGQLQSRNTALQYSVLMLDIEIVAATGDRLSLGDSEPMLDIVTKSLCKLYPRENAQAYAGDGKFVLLLTTRKFQDSLVLARKILQLIPKMVPHLNNMALLSHASILRVDRNAEVDGAAVIEQCQAACLKTRKDGRDNTALVLPYNKYLSSVAPSSGASEKQQTA